MLLIRILSILSEIKHNSIIIIEEPELHLDPAWATHLTTLLTTMFSAFRAHFWIATHSHCVINSVSSARLLSAHDGTISTVDTPTLLSNQSELAWLLYSPRPSSVEMIVNAAIDNATPETLDRLTGQLGESSFRVQAWKRARELRGGN